MHQPAWLFPSLLSSAPLTPKGSTPGTSPPHLHLPNPCHTCTPPHSTSTITLPLHNPIAHGYTFPTPLLSCAGWYGTPWRRRTREDKSGILVKQSGGGYDPAFPTASVPPPLSNLLISTQRFIAHIATGNGYSQTVAFCPRMDPPPIPPSPPPTSGWLAPLLQREGGKGYMCVWGGQDGFGIDIRQVGIARHEDGKTDSWLPPD